MFLHSGLSCRCIVSVLNTPLSSRKQLSLQDWFP
nr:MAG TPA: hypothetical protein [Caudoviricetes sp.]